MASNYFSSENNLMNINNQPDSTKKPNPREFEIWIVVKALLKRLRPLNEAK